MYLNLFTNLSLFIFYCLRMAICCILTTIIIIRNSMNERKHFFIKKGLMFLWCVRDGRRDICSERGLLLPISSSRSQGVPTLAPPCKLVRDASDRLRVPPRQRFSALYLNLTAWFSSRDLLPVTHLLYPSALITPLFTNQNVTACQSTRGH